jgi:hypothetical protein
MMLLCRLAAEPFNKCDSTSVWTDNALPGSCCAPASLQHSLLLLLLLLQSLVGLNFNQEAVEADMRYGLVRVRENAESIAFYGGQNNEMAALMQVRAHGVSAGLSTGRAGVAISVVQQLRRGLCRIQRRTGGCCNQCGTAVAQGSLQDQAQDRRVLQSL